eukprot:4341519-Pleurochrysis_carterae.AAC.1
MKPHKRAPASVGGDAFVADARAGHHVARAHVDVAAARRPLRRAIHRNLLQCERARTAAAGAVMRGGFWAMGSAVTA